jgi:hypothetical protein
MNKERIPKVSNMKVKGKHPRGRVKLGCEQQVREDVTQSEGRTGIETEGEEELWKDKQRGLVVRWPT